MDSAGVAFLAICMVTLSSSSVAMPTDHIVGYESGWTLDFNYSEWPKDKVFRVGDSLGKKWYICGVGNYGAQCGMKLVINVQEPLLFSSADNVVSSIYALFLADIVV